MSEWMAKQARIAHSLEHPYMWRITEDRDFKLNGGDKSWVGTVGPSTAPEEDPEDFGIVGIKFRLLDEGDIDDCNQGQPGAVGPGHELYGVVYEGVLYDPEEEWPFGPLDDFGRPNYGCTEIQHFNDKTQRWEHV